MSDDTKPDSKTIMHNYFITKYTEFTNKPAMTVYYGKGGPSKEYVDWLELHLTVAMQELKQLKENTNANNK